MSHREDDTDIFQQPKDMATSSTTAADNQKQSPHLEPDRQVSPDGTITKDLKDGLYMAGLPCPNQTLGLLCGREQREIKEWIKRHPGLQIELQKGPRLTRDEAASAPFDKWLSNRLTTVVVAHKEKEVVESVLKEVKERIISHKRSAPYTHFVSLPLLDESNEGIREKVRLWREAILTSHADQKDGIDESIVVTPNRLHFTLIMLRIYDEETLNRIDEVMKKAVQIIREKNVAKFPMPIHFKGVHMFDNEKPESASIVFTHAGVSRLSLGSISEPSEPETVVPLSPEVRRACVRDLEVLSRNQLRLKTRTERVVSTIEPVTSLKENVSQLKEFVESLNKADQTVRSIIPQIRGGNARVPRSTRDTSSVEGPEASKIFAVFEVLVKLLSDEGILKDEDKRERRIFSVEGHPDELDKRSLVLHLTLINNKWRSTSMTKKLVDKLTAVNDPANLRRQPRFRKFNIPFNAQDVLDTNCDFGSAALTQMHLSRRSFSNPTEFYYAEKTYSLC